MNLDLTEQQRMLRDTVRDFAAGELRPIAGRLDDAEEFPHDIVRKMGELGFLGIPIPEDLGGAGFDTLSYALAVEEVARVDGGTALTLAAHTSLGTGPILHNGSEAQKRRWIPPLASGQYLGCFGLSEPGAGPDAAGCRTTATRRRERYVVNGAKMWITNASHAGSIVFTARTEPGSSGARGISAFVAPLRGVRGVAVKPIKNKLGVRSSDTTEIHFDEFETPAENLLGEEHTGFRAFMRTLEGGRISIGALALGLAEGAFDAAVAYVKERRQFGKPLGGHQAIQKRIADMAVEIEAARHLVYHAARLKDAGRPFGVEASMAKLYASEAAMRATYSAIQCHGGYGFTKEYTPERFWRDAKLCTIGEGTSEVQRLVIARSILGRL
ncbi:MAG: acyl-CoA dehydrogenase family protein [Planctomycetes bacterium]|nr:acyl-CoA dehydrogenase family protein [Planctomycetota bacterium]